MRLRSSAVSFILALMALAVASSASNQAWVRRYSGSGKQYDSPNAMALDSAGNVYVTGSILNGSHAYNVATIKYDTNGSQKWIAAFTGAGADNAGRAIAVDTLGNVYVGGNSFSSIHNGYDFLVVKYDTNGNQKWYSRYNGPGNKDDIVVAIAVDNAGNVYATGYSDGGATSWDYTTIKYDTNGKEKWVKRYDGLGHGKDQPTAMTLDDVGNVYVTGSVYSGASGATDYDYLTIKYDTSGKQLWTQRYNGSLKATDVAYAITVDGLGNVIVTGDSQGSGTSDDYLTLKYNKNGLKLWEKRYNGPSNGRDMAYALALDTAGNVYVTGGSDGGASHYDYATIKYDPSGIQKWVKRYNGPQSKDDIAYAIFVDDAGSVYVTGGSMTSASSSLDYVSIKYDNTGHQHWVQIYNGPANGKDIAYAIKVDSTGNAFVTGTSDGGTATGNDYATVKYTP